MIKLGIQFLKISLIYLVIAAAMGTLMTIEPIYKFTVLSSMFGRAHAHISLIGWVTFAMIGIIYMAIDYFNKSLYSNRLGNMGFWFLNIGVIVEYIILLIGGFNQACLYSIGDPTAHTIALPYTMFIMIFAVIMLIGIYLTTYNIYRSLK